MTGHDLTVLLIVSGLGIAAGMAALAGWPSFLNRRRRPKDWREL